MHPMYQHSCRHRCPYQCTARNPPQCASRNTPPCAPRNTPQCTPQCGQAAQSPCPGIVATVLVHGGAGTVADEYIPAIKEGIKLAARIGYTTLCSTGSVLDAVQEAVSSLEADPNFNSGYGSALTWDGKVEMDAAIMSGENLNAGCVSIARDVLNPVALARRVMEKTRHKFLAGDGLMQFAIEENFNILPENSLVTPKALKSLEDYKASLNFSASPIFGRFNNLAATRNSIAAKTNETPPAPTPAPVPAPAPGTCSTTSVAGSKIGFKAGCKAGSTSTPPNTASLASETEPKMLGIPSVENSSPEILIDTNTIGRNSALPRKSSQNPIAMRRSNLSLKLSVSLMPQDDLVVPQNSELQDVPLSLTASQTSPSMKPLSPDSSDVQNATSPPQSDPEQQQSDFSTPSGNRSRTSGRNKKRYKKNEYEYGSPGTVGAVAIDEYGNVAAATSTGGITGKMPGRIGDSPILGGGTYADNESGCVSATGQGETIMRYNVASRILALIKHEGMGAQQATVAVLDEMLYRFNQTAGIISIDRDGRMGIYFTSHRMSWAYQRGRELHYGIEKTDDIMEIVGEPRIQDFGCYDN